MGKKHRQMQKASKKQNSSTPLSAEVKGVLSLVCAIILSLSLLSFTGGDASSNWLGLLGFILAWTCQYLFGLGSYLIVFYLIGISIAQFRKTIPTLPLRTHLYFFLGLSSSCILLALLEERRPDIGELASSFVYSDIVTTSGSVPSRFIRYYLGGVPFHYIYQDLPYANLKYLLSYIGTALVCTTGLLISLMTLTGISTQHIHPLFQKFRSSFERTLSWIKENLPKRQAKSNDDDMIKVRVNENSSHPTPSSSEILTTPPAVKANQRPSLLKKEKYTEAPKVPLPPQAPSPSLKGKTAIIDPAMNHFKIPVQNLLQSAKKIDQSALKKNLRQQAKVLEETLLSFGIEAKVGEINCGPTITSFEVHPAIGVKVQKIKALENDIALNLEAQSIRIIAPIPGKAAVGIEVPNPFPQEVSFKEMLHAYQQGQKKHDIPVLLGKTVHGTHVTADLTKMPHCIIAGATGSGKSVCINTIVMSILMNARPDEIKLLMVDPKKVELTPYTHLPHMIAPVITEPQGASAALNWLVKEMELRYEILKQLGVRNITAFNGRKRDAELESSLAVPIPERMPYIVGIIDELADLMMVSSSDIETPIARIAQMARAVGIHLILATQRPSREVITGLIKANFPTRISFKVASRVNSQIILDESGAESLLGNGDMLFLPPGTSNLTRAQGAYIRDEDINKVIDCICSQAPTNYLIKSFDKPQDGDFSSPIAKEDKKLDTLFAQARDLVLKTGNASTTFLQRKLKVGYARAAGLMDQLEAANIVGPQDGSKPRQILVQEKKESQD